MTRRLMCWAVLGFFLFGIFDSALAARSSRKTSRHRSPSTRKVPVTESLVLPPITRQVPHDESQSLRIHAASAILIDAHSGAVLYEQSADAPLPPASVTKILTALVILEQGHLQDTVVVSPVAAGTGGHRLGLRAHQRISLGDLLAAILIRSANDAAVAAAEHVAGDLDGFVALMNAKARELGMVSSQFANPHGLDAVSHYTTARDMARLTRVALDHPTFAELVRSPQARLTIWKPGRRKPVAQTRIVVSHNRLLGQLHGADGVKTGYTGSAGRCLVASASRGSQRMIAVLLNDPRRWYDAAALLEYGFGSLGDPARTRPTGRPWHPRLAEEWLRLEAQAWSEERP